ncbi:MAG TPA: 2-phosphosulfolactate phosphatase [Lentimicrobium sp.]|nr:2-phosphosulfolactate phosphatase [Lentimicrobium sp.]
MPKFEVCFSPVLFSLIEVNEPTIIVVIDVLRATTSFCTAFDFGVEAIVPLDSIEKAIEYKNNGFIVAAERDGLKPDFADLSNSAFDFMNTELTGKTIYYTTTNGTKAIKLGENKGTVAIGSFLNLPALANWLTEQGKNVIVLCAGWKDNYCIEDTLCAGALADLVISQGKFLIESDAALASLLLWNSNSKDPETLITRSAHYLRLKQLGFENVLKYSLQIGKSHTVPVLIEGKLLDLNKSKKQNI